MSDTISNAHDNAKLVGDGKRAALPAQPAVKRTMSRKIAVAIRAPFLPDHPQAAHGLHGHHKGHSKR